MFELTPFGGIFTAYPFFKESEQHEKRGQAPAFKTDIRETESAYLIDAELPGFSKDELSIEVKEDIMTVSAEHKSENASEENGKYIRRERTFSSFRRSFNLEGIRSADISASHKDGILTLVLPKELPKEPEIRRVAIA